MTDAVHVGDRRRAGTQKLKYLRKHNAYIVGVGLVNIPNRRLLQHTAYLVLLEVFEVEILAIKDRAEIMTEPTIIATLLIPPVPVRTPGLSAYTAQTPIARARDLVGYHRACTSLPIIPTS